MAWYTHRVAGHPVDLFLPKQSPRYTLMYLHDWQEDRLREDSVWTAELEARQFCCVAPEGGISWWCDRLDPDFDMALTPERWIIDHILPWLSGLEPVSSRPLALFGVGMGGQGALRLGFKHPARFPVVGAFDASIDHYEWYGLGTALDVLYQSREQCRQDSVPMHIHPVRQPPHIWFAVERSSPWYRGNDRLHEKLGALGVAHQMEILEMLPRNGPERLSIVPKVMRYLEEALVVEGRRLL